MGTLMKPTKQLLVTFPLHNIIHDLLHGEHYVSISEEVADCITMVTSNKHTAHIQYPSDDDCDILGQLITTPILWEIGAWQTSSEKWQRAKSLSQKRIDERNILEANIQRISKAILRTAYVGTDAARTLARIMLDRKDYSRIESLGVSKLITKTEEL